MNKPNNGSENTSIMCGLFVDADDSLWTCSTKSMRIDGVVTSIRLESFFWMTLGEIADRDDLSVSQLITKLYLEAMDAKHDLGNFTSFLRVCCCRYLSLVADGRLQRDDLTPLTGMESGPLLEMEKEDTLKRQNAISSRRASLS